MAKRSKSSPFKTEAGQAALVLGCSALLGLAVNYFSANSLPIYAQETAAPASAGSGGPVTHIPAEAENGKIPVDDVMRAANDANAAVRIVDVRGEAEFDTGHIPRSFHASLESMVKSRTELDSALKGAT